MALALRVVALTPSLSGGEVNCRCRLVVYFFLIQPLQGLIIQIDSLSYSNLIYRIRFRIAIHYTALHLLLILNINLNILKFIILCVMFTNRNSRH